MSFNFFEKRNIGASKLFLLKKPSIKNDESRIEKEMKGALKDLFPIVFWSAISMIVVSFYLNVFTSFGLGFKIFISYILFNIVMLFIINKDKTLTKIKFQIVYILSSMILTIPFLLTFLAMYGVFNPLVTFFGTIFAIPAVFNYGYLKEN